MVRTELGTVRVGEEYFEFAHTEKEVEVRKADNAAIYMRGRVIQGDRTDLPEEFDDAFRRLSRIKPR